MDTGQLLTGYVLLAQPAELKTIENMLSRFDRQTDRQTEWQQHNWVLWCYTGQWQVNSEWMYWPMLADVGSALLSTAVMLTLCSAVLSEDVLCKTGVSGNVMLPVVGNLDAKYSARWRGGVAVPNRIRLQLVSWAAIHRRDNQLLSAKPHLSVPQYLGFHFRDLSWQKSSTMPYMAL